MFDANRGDLLVGVIGAGVMGRGVAQSAAQAGFGVRLLDSDPAVVGEAREFVSKMLERGVAKGRLARGDADAALARIGIAHALADLADCQLVCECVREDLAVKQELFRALDELLPTSSVIATNTSSLSVTAIAAACRRPERVAGMHFFNPVPLMGLVEVVSGVHTAPTALMALDTVARRMGKHPVWVGDSPGFLVNHAARGYAPEALRILSEGIADVVTIDRLMRDVAGFPMGPFELLDLTGLDVSHPVMERIYHQFYQEPMYRPSVVARTRVAAGMLGRKSGSGFYAYPQGQQQLPDEPPPTARPARLWLPRPRAGEDAGALERNAALRALLVRIGADLDHGARPSGTSVVLLAPLAEDASHACARLELDPVRTLAVDTFCDMDNRRTLARTPLTDPISAEAARAALALDGTPVSVINDGPGFVVPRILALLVNVACHIAQGGIARPDDIDTAVKLGLNYPRGPLEWGDALGPRRILTLLDGMTAFYGEPRYRPSPWLRRRAVLGASLLVPDS